MSHDEVEAVDRQARLVAAHLPFSAELDADMGGTFALQIDLGRRGGPDDPRDSAGIDPEPEATWWLDVEGGRETIVSDLRLDAEPAVVADWIAGEARRAGSPAATSATAIAATGYRTPASMATRPAAPSTTPSRSVPSAETGSELER